MSDKHGFKPCMFCGQYVDSHRESVGTQVVALRVPDRGGFRYIDTKPTGRVACARCLDRLAAGVHPLQASML